MYLYEPTYITQVYIDLYNPSMHLYRSLSSSKVSRRSSRECSVFTAPWLPNGPAISSTNLLDVELCIEWCRKRVRWWHCVASVFGCIWMLRLARPLCRSGRWALHMSLNMSLHWNTSIYWSMSIYSNMSLHWNMPLSTGIRASIGDWRKIGFVRFALRFR